MFKTALKLLKKIEDNGYEAYIVGGFVRDYILGRESIDIDIATNATPRDIKSIFNNIILPKEEYGSVTLMFKNYRFEITTYRKEITYLNNRKPIEIEYIDDLLTDLRRRDFTINTLCMNSKGELIDLLDGRKDIEEKVINTVGNSDYKFMEDSLRILRAIRFATILNFTLSDEVKKAIIKNKDTLNNLSYNRKRQELDKIFSSSNVRYGVDLLIELGLDETLEIYNLKDIKLSNDLIGIWASLNVSDKYPFNNHEKEIIKKVKELLVNNITGINLYRYGLYLCQVAADIMNIDRADIAKRYGELVLHSRDEIAISSEEIMTLLNKKPGRYFKDIYYDLENKILTRELNNEKNAIIAYLLANYS